MSQRQKQFLIFVLCLLAATCLYLKKGVNGPEIVTIGTSVSTPDEIPSDEAPLPVIDYKTTFSDCTVEVSNYKEDGSRSYGQGVVVQHQGDTFVLTSTMIFTHAGDITVGEGRFTFDAEISHRDEDLGLVALKCDLREGSSYVTITDFPSIPPDVLVQVGENEVNTLEYMNDEWVMLDGGFPVDTTGAPVSQNGDLVGIIVGLNRVNTEQAIMVGNHGIQTFVEDMFRPEQPTFDRAYDGNPNEYTDEYTDEELPFGGFFRRMFGG